MYVLCNVTYISPADPFPGLDRHRSAFLAWRAWRVAVVLLVGFTGLGGARSTLVLLVGRLGEE